MTLPQVLELTEYQTRTFPADTMPAEIGRHIWTKYGKNIIVDAPTFRTDNQWQLTSQGFIGHIPVTEDFRILLQPKVELANLFRMLEYAYNIPFEVLGDLVGASSLPEFYNRLANILALRVADRTRKGLYREYSPRSNRLPFVRGRIVLESMLRSPWEVELDCRYQVNTSDIDENRLLAWTLFCIARSGLCNEDVAQTVRRAYRGVRNYAGLCHYAAESCRGRSYNRLNIDYHPLHAICRFFLENAGPTHEEGEQIMLPFLVDMASLFEAFVAQWLRLHIPDHLMLEDQVLLQVGSVNKVDFRLDLVIKDRETNRPLCLLDTKYKAASSPSADDVQQVIAYAKVLGCQEAILVYPKALDKPFDALIDGDIHVWSATFCLDGDLDANGWSLLNQIIELTGCASTSLVQV